MADEKLRCKFCLEYINNDKVRNEKLAYKKYYGFNFHMICFDRAKKIAKRRGTTVKKVIKFIG